MISIRYDGTNGEYIAGTWCTSIAFVSDTGTVLTFTDVDSNTRTANLGDWLVAWEASAMEATVLTQAQYEATYLEIG
jgi:hypothetical protein